MATEAQIRAAILATLSGVTGIGRVHDRERFAAAEKDFASLYVDTDRRLRGWNFQRVSVVERDLGTGEVRRLMQWRITGYLAWDDAAGTAHEIQGIVEAIAAAFRLDRTLGGVVDDLKDLSQSFGESGIQVEAIEPVLFAGVLCHRARLRLITETTEPN